MRFPYGIAGFRKIREEGYFYVNRTDRLTICAVFVRANCAYALLDHLLEFKAVSLKAVGLASTELVAKTREELRALPAVADSLQEAETQLATYRQALEGMGGDRLKLRTHAVVGIGLERLVW